ncbi:S10 family peptidase [Jiangella anatolica]|uniref:Peptidase S10 n=1 Tax=Jiangella anatolica TaxID=2670374 RepID=A0A2W2C8R0_9ACTN|nr:peptidase S10 [Jiangella anatolica]PZF84557.1 peptidase S10 [Jiangella anatolica]
MTDAEPKPKDDDVTHLEDELVTTHHDLDTPDGRLSYTAKAGRVVLWEDKVEDDVWKGRRPRAQVGLTAYTLDDADASTRPVTFAFNGGPGSASVWLHLGVLGPRRVVMGDVGELAPPPYGLADNPESLLTASDLVFIDPVSTGRSRVVDGEKAGDFHGFTADIESVGEIIRQWVTAEGRWLSPKLLAGESYGTTRAAALAQHLQSTGMYLNGLMLISCALNFGVAEFQVGNDNAYARYLPFYAAAAHYHGRHPGRELRDVVAEAEGYAARDYLYVLARGSRLSGQERANAVATVARLAGVSEDYVDRADLRLEHWRYFTELRRADGLSVGRLDARFTGPAGDGVADGMDADPSMDAILGPYATAYQHYARAELGIEDTTPFHVFGPDVIGKWSYKEFENAPVSVLDRLSRAMRQNPHLRVHVAFGYYDGATPFSCAEDDLAHLKIPADLQGNIERRYYEAGHMMYVHEPSRLRQSADLVDFVRRATAG